MFCFGSNFVLVCVHIHFYLEQVLSMEGVVLGEELLVEYNGQKFRHNDLVDVIVGTGPGVRGLKAEPLKARFKGVIDSVRGPEFLCRPLVGSGRGPELLHLEYVFLAPERRDISRN